jgi:alkaline phosphatase
MNYKRLTTTTLVTFAILLSLGPAAPAKQNYDSKDPNNQSATRLSFYQRAFDLGTLPHHPGNQPRNVILCIGDGMGYGQVALARLQTLGCEGRLHMEKLPIQGMAWTHSADSLVTDSAAAGTALACGIKTTNQTVGQDPEGIAYLSLTEAAMMRGMQTGLVATSSITHATPASFAAHVKRRKQETDIAAQIIDAGIHVLFGGGRKFFLPVSHPEGTREDGRDLIAEAREAGYQYVQSPADLWHAQSGRVLGLFQAEALETELPEPTLAELTQKAVRLLSDGNSAGFFLMVEGSQIDWACHANHVDNTVRQTLLFDEAVRVAADFALRDQQTLVVVTADHETGGLVVDSPKTGGAPQASWASKGHSAMPVPIFALGPGAEHFSGSLDNTDIARRLARLMNIRDFPRARQAAAGNSPTAAAGLAR